MLFFLLYFAKDDKNMLRNLAVPIGMDRIKKGNTACFFHAVSPLKFTDIYLFALNFLDRRIRTVVLFAAYRFVGAYLYVVGFALCKLGKRFLDGRIFRNVHRFA
jgi:hypothetical protein